MAGIGVRLNKIYEKNTITTDLYGAGYSVVVTIAPMLVVIGALIFMEWALEFSTLGFAARELFSCTILYIFIFALLTAAPFNSVLSRYMSDVIYEEKYEDMCNGPITGKMLRFALPLMLSSMLQLLFNAATPLAASGSANKKILPSMGPLVIFMRARWRTSADIMAKTPLSLLLQRRRSKLTLIQYNRNSQKPQGGPAMEFRSAPCQKRQNPL